MATLNEVTTARLINGVDGLRSLTKLSTTPTSDDLGNFYAWSGTPVIHYGSNQEIQEAYDDTGRAMTEAVMGGGRESDWKTPLETLVGALDEELEDLVCPKK